MGLSEPFSCWTRVSRHAVAGLALLLLGLPATTLSLSAQGLNLLGGDAIPDLFLSPENAVQPTRVIDGSTGAELGAGFPFGPFGGGNRIAAGDLNDDGVADIVAGMGAGGSFVQLYDGTTIASLGGGFPFGPFGGGVFLAIGDLNGDGRNDIGVSQGPGGGLVRVFNGIDYSMLLNLAPFGAGYTGGVSVAMGDLNADGRSDLIVGQLTGGLVSIIDGATQGTLVSGAPFGGHTGGVHVASGDVNADGRADIILAPATRGGIVVVYDLQTVSQIGSFFPYGPSFAAGVRVATADTTGDGRAEIITGPGPGGGAEVRTFSGASFSQIQTVTAYGGGYSAGVFVAATAPSAIRFTSPARTTFSVGQAGSFTVRTAALPPATSLTQSGALPAGVTFTDNGDGSATLAGTPTAGGSFALTFTASGGARPAATQAFTLTVEQVPAITSAAAATFSIGGSATFTISATGFPPPTISRDGTLPTGVTLTPHANGTATLAGTPQPGSEGSYPLTITANNGVGAAAVQAFVLTVDARPVFTSPATTTFFVGVAGTFAVTTGGARPVTSITRAGTLPTGVSFTDNGNGRATIAGTPDLGGTYPLTLRATNDQGQFTDQAFTLIVDMAPSAQDDTYINSVGNTQYVVGVGAPATPAVVVSGSVLDNDTGIGPFSVGPPSIASANGGQVAMSAAGGFIYTPPVGFAGPADTFTYTLTDAAGRTDTALVTISFSGVIWYVNATAGTGNGRSDAPFNSLAAAQAGAPAGQTIYLHQGTYNGNTTLRVNEVLRGAGQPLVVNQAFTIPAMGNPVLNGTMTLADGVLASGFVVSRVVAGGGTGNIGFGALISNTSGRSVDVQNRTGGTITFSGGISDTGAGIFLHNNPGATIAFTGGLLLSTGASDAFTATGGGTVTATQNNTSLVNTVTTTSGVAVHVANTQIGNAGLTFRSVNAGTNDLSPGAGIILDTTGVGGANGGLTVTGTGTAASGGRIWRKTGANGAPTAGVAIYLNQTKSPSFSFMELRELDNAGIVGRNVYGFSMANSVIAAAGNSAGWSEGPIVFGLPAPSTVNGLIGSGTIFDTTIESGAEHQLAVYQHSGSMRLVVEGNGPVQNGCFIGAEDGSTAGDGVHVQVNGTGNATVEVHRCYFRRNGLAALRGAAAGSSQLNLTVTGSDATPGGPGQEGFVLTNSGDADVTTTITDNILTYFPGSAIRIGQQAGNASADSLLRATVSGNSIVSAVGAAAPAVATHLSSTFGQVSQARLLISGNTISQYTLVPGIQVRMPDAGTTPGAGVTVLDNHVDLHEHPPGSGVRGLRGIVLQASQPGAYLCANVLNNVSHWRPTWVGDGGGILADQSGGATFQLEAGTQSTGTPATTVLNLNNIVLSPEEGGPSSISSATGAVAVVANRTCLVPAEALERAAAR